jgi:hypothetical protein
MQRQAGRPGFPIWLLGDSNPEHWQDILVTPLDPRHPARHSIWTPVLDVIQDRVYRKIRSRIDTTSIYIRNAIEDPASKPPGNRIDWLAAVAQEVDTFRQLLLQHRPMLVLCFGAFAFEFGRRAIAQEPKRPYVFWGARTLGDEFRRRVGEFNATATNVLPLLHTSISRGRFIESHNYFSDQEGGNYFEFAGQVIADMLIQHQMKLEIWVE